MSQLKVDTITDEAGTGAPDFPNGVSGDGSGLTNLPAPTSAQVGTATAGLAAGAVGSYAFLAQPDSNATALTAGTTYAGSGLRFFGISGGNFTGGNAFFQAAGSTPAGTWQAMGTASKASFSAIGCTLFLRIS
jgi:hypothetical protein